MAHQWKIRNSGKQIEQHINSRVSRQIYDDCTMLRREYKLIILDPYSKELNSKSNNRTICEKKAERSLFSHENKSHEPLIS